MSETEAIMSTLAKFPLPIDNRAGLSHVSYRIGTYAHLREALLGELNRDALLRAWTHRGADDPGIALLEGAAILGDILTFYQEVYANEAFLRTAQWRESIADLVALLGYRLRPGVGGKAAFALEVKSDKPVLVPKGFAIKADLEKAGKPIDFETSADLMSYPWLSKFHLHWPLEAVPINNGTNEFYVGLPDAVVNPPDIKEGDRLLVGNWDDEANRVDHPEVVLVKSLRKLGPWTLYTIEGGLTQRAGPVPVIAACKLGRSFRHFGHNAPLQYTSVEGESVVQKDHLYGRPLGTDTVAVATASLDLTGRRGIRVVDPSLDELCFPLDAEVNDLPAGRPIIVQGRFYGQGPGGADAPAQDLTLVRSIDRTFSLSLTWGALSGAATCVTLQRSLESVLDSWRYYYVDIRTLRFHEVLQGPMVLRATPRPTGETTGRRLYFLGTGAQAEALKNRTLLFVDSKSGTVARNVVEVGQQGNMVQPLHVLPRAVTLDQDVAYDDFPVENPAVTVYGNVVQADQGKTEKETVLGNGDNQQVFQVFKLAKAPLTYRRDPEVTPPETPELVVYVNQIAWTRVDSFFGYGSQEEIYVVRQDEKGDSWVQFGDGKAGARLPSGKGNITAKYRIGIGAYGPLKPDTKPQPGGKLSGLDKIQMPGVAAGGAQPETGENARLAAPGKIQSLGRLISLADFEAEALAIAGVLKASAAWQLVDNVPTVVITVLLQTGRVQESGEIEEALRKANGSQGPSRFPVQIIPGHVQYVYVDAVVCLDARYQTGPVRAAIEQALGVTAMDPNAPAPATGLFSLSRRSFDQAVYATQVEGALQNVEGVVWARVTGLGTLDPDQDDPSRLSLPPAPRPVQDAVAAAAHILGLYAGHLQLGITTGASQGI